MGVDVKASPRGTNTQLILIACASPRYLSYSIAARSHTINSGASANHTHSYIPISCTWRPICLKIYKSPKTYKQSHTIAFRAVFLC